MPHIIPRAQLGPDDLDNLITLCDLCHAVVTPRWHKPWFPDGKNVGALPIAEIRAEFEEFLGLPIVQRRERQRRIWESFGISPADYAGANV